MIDIDFSSVALRLKKEHNKTYVFDIIRKGWYVLTPEEHVRQYFLHYITETLQYPSSLIAVEKLIVVGSLRKRFDIIVYNRDHKPWMLIECKAPEVPITELTLNQLLSYQQTAQCSYWVITNGHQNFCADACDINNIKWLNALPSYS
ncbi:MAG: type I restriction enzyme HsdR N-terminal domain-containing protein [Flavipsychrobacter sp.]